MRAEQCCWTSTQGWQLPDTPILGADANLLLVFGSCEALEQKPLLAQLQQRYPNALITGCSTAGEIHNHGIRDDSLVATAIAFDATRLQLICEPVNDDDSFSCGQRLAQSLAGEDLAYVLLLSDGLRVNGSELLRGLYALLPPQIAISGGLAGDGSRFERTHLLQQDQLLDNSVLALGFYSKRLHTGHGSLGGWDVFGPARLVTRSHNNVLYELDGKSALSLYKRYLGNHVNDLPASALLFPLSLRHTDAPDEVGLVRTILSIDEEAQSMTFAGDIPEGRYVRLMKSRLDNLIDGAIGAAQASLPPVSPADTTLAILISCVGRKLVLRQRVDEEFEGVRSVLGSQPLITGFYSYGEISPHIQTSRCELHNQSMTVTTLREI